jgi:hypothetical protein
MTTTKAEKETILRWDQEERVLHLYTVYAVEARRWERLGYAVDVCGRTRTGEPTGWQAPAPLDAVRLRRLVDGKVARRPRGPGFAVRPHKFAASEHPSGHGHIRGRFRRVRPSKAANDGGQK